MSHSKRLVVLSVFLVLLASIAIGSGVPPIGDFLTVRETPVEDVTPSPAASADMPSRLTPLRVRFTGAGGAGDPAAVIDRDTRTGFSAGGAFTLIFDLEQAQVVAGIRVFGRPDATLSVACASGEGWMAVPGLQDVRASFLAPGWNDLAATPACATSAVRVDVASAAGETVFPEIEIWGAGTPVVPAAPQALRTYPEPSLPWSLRSFDAALPESTVEGSAVTASLEIPRTAAQFRRAYLLYKLNGLSSWRAVPRRINGRPVQGGVIDTPAVDWSPQIERINPDWLREGTNEIAFLPKDGAEPYTVRDVRLLVELDTGANSVELASTPEEPETSRGANPAVDGELATPWTPFPPSASPGSRSALALTLDRAVETASLGLLLKSAPSGSIQVQTVGEDGTTHTVGARSGTELRAGWNVIPLEPGFAAPQLRILFEAGASGGWEPLEIVPLGSGVGGRAEPPSLTIVWPFRGEFMAREAVVRGFVTPDPTGLPVRVTIGTSVVETTDGAFGATVSKDDVGFFDDPDEAPWSIGIQALYAGGRTLARTVRLTNALEGPHSIDGQLLGSRSFSVQPGQAKKIRHDGAGLDLEAGSVDRPKDVKITPLRDQDLPALDTGMTNVTKGPRRGYRFEPHGSRFAKPLRVSLPYDASLVPEGMTEDDVTTFYFDDQTGRWVPLDRVAVDPGAKTVVSITNHFTDMINATLSVPEHPELLSHQPTMFAKVPPADPAERIVLIEPPKASNFGEARVTYPLDLPPGRSKMTPELRIDYASTGSNGWLGMGWSLSIPSVALDTRWGAPRFDAALETETYTLHGEQLTPLAHREALEPRTAEKTFHFRREGRFARIVRHGDRPANYWWESTDKDGTVSVFGGDLDTTLADDQGRITRWLLREKRDPHGNGISFGYARVDDPGLMSGTVPGRQLYLQTIRYTTSGGDAGLFTVRMIRNADLGEPRRPDVLIDARGGFKEVTSQLLRRIVVDLGGATIRSWDLAYRRGAFEKTLLDSVTQRGSDGSVLATHRFAYFDDVRDGAAYTGFAPTETWSTGADGVRSTAVDEVASLFGSDAGRATALSAFTTTHAGGHLYAGFNPDAPQKQGSAGGKVGFNGTVSSEGLLALADLNGDHLPDKVFKTSSGIFIRLNRSGPNGTTEFGPSIAVASLPAISSESTATVSFGAESYFGVTAIANESTGITTALTYITDVNGDGLSDLVDGGTVLFNHLDADGVPTFDPDSSTSPAPVGPAAVDAASLLPDLGAQLDRIRENAPLQDTLRRWVAPYPGHVRISGDASLTAPATPGVLDDGVRVTIQHNGSELWSQTIASGDATAYSPAGVDSVEVAPGDRIYFRVQSGVEGSHDVVSWDPEITYVGAPSVVDANGLDPYRFRASEDFVLAGRPGILVKIPFTGRVRLTGDLNKTGMTTDAIVLLVLKNGQQVYADVLQANETGSMPLGISFDVAQDDTLQLRVRADSPIDLRKIEWAPSMFYVAPPDGPAPTHTIDGNTVTIERVVDEAGHPLIQLHPPYHIDMYPVDGLATPQSPWVADDDETVTVSSHLTASPGATGVVFMTAKRRGELIAKRTIFVTNGVVQNRQVDIDVEDGDRIFFDYSCLDPDLAPFVGHRVIEVDGDAVPSAFHTSARQGAFPLAYRGWSVAGYNGNPPRDTDPIVEADLDPAYDEDSEVDPRTDKIYLYTPFPEGGTWRGPEEETFIAASTAASSRLGPNAIPSPSAPGGATRAPFRLSSSLQVAGELGVGLLSGSTSVGNGGSDVDFLDMNGDQFPDVVGRSRVQYSPAVGGLEAASRDVGGFEAPRKSDSAAGNIGVGGSPASFSVGARGQVDTPGRGGGPKQNTTGSQMVSLGLSGGLGTGSSSVPYDLLDVNGDGLPDRVTVSGGALSVGFNLGYGFAPSEPWGVGALNEGSSDSASIGTNLGFNGGIYDYAGGASLSRNLSETSAMLTDINGDGLPDRITRNGSALSVGFNTGSGFLADTAWGGAPDGAFATTRATSIGGGAYFTVGIGPVCVVECWIILNPGVDVSTSLARQESALLDVDGDGYPDHVQSGAEAAMTVARNTTGRTNLLRSIARPLGATIELDYARDGNTSDLPQSHWDLARVAVSDGLPGDGADVQLATFKYEKGMWDRLEREFYGYGRVIEEVRDASHGEALVRTITRDFAVDSFYTKGLLLRERLEDALGRPFTETEHAYSTIDVGTQAPLSDLKSTIATGFPGLVRTDRRFFEGQAAPGKATYSTQEFDAVGNVVRTADIGDDGAEDDLEATLTYSSCSGTHIVGTPVAIRVTGNGTELRRRDGVVDCATGDVTLITEHLADGTGAETALAYDALGNLTRLTGPPNRNGQRYEMHYEYDPVVKTHVTQVTDSFGYASTTSYDVALGSKVGTRDVDGSRTSYAYDVHGRLTSIRGPYEQTGANPTVRFEHHPDAPVPWSLTRHLDTYRSPSDPIDVVRFVDGLKRDVQEKSDASVFTSAAGGPTDVMTVSGRVLFDPLGRLTDRFHPVVEPTGTPGVFRATFDTVAPTHTTFDVLDRPLVVTLPDGTSTTAAYGFGTTREGSSQMVKHVTDANGSESAAFRNVRDLVTASQEILAAQPIWTSYAYDALDRLTRITDDHANVTRVVWDNLGRKTVVDSPDEGRTEDAYDLAGNRVSRVTANLRARGRRIDYDYEFKRLSRMVYPDFPGNNVTYTYGAPGAPLNRAGRVFRIVDQSGTRERAFGKLGETVSETRTIASTIPSGVQTYMTQYTLDSFNRMQQLVYPDGETLTLRYDAGGRLRNITGRKGAFDYEYLRRMEYDKFGERTFMEGGNGTRTAYAYRPDNRRLSTVLATRSDGRPFVDMAYAYDAVGNVLSRTNSVPVATGSDFGGPSVQSFAYDDLDRMTSSRGSYTYAPNKTDQYVVAFDYDTIYNMTSRHQLHEIVQPSGSTVTQGKTTYAFAYAYGGPQPHAATHVGDRTLAYDADGNQAGWQDDRNGTRRSIVWDEENRMQSLFDNGHEFRFLYDDAGDRVIKRGPQGETVYVNPWMTMRNGTIGTKHVWAGTTRIASKLMKSQAFEKDRYFYHADHSGSTNFVTDATGRLYEHLEYFPFGETWVQESSNTQRTPYAFTGKELDEETGLTYFGARFLDPRLGSFNSGEPLLVGSPEKGKDDPRFLSVYSYAHQNPQRFADPDGKDVIILVGQPGDQKWRDNRIVKEGFPAAAKLLAAELKSKGITAHIVDLGTFGGDRPSATGALAQKAGSIKKVEGVVYIGHGDPSNGQMTPSNKGPNVSVKEMVDAARIVKDGSFVAYGCEVSVGKSLTDIRSRGVNVYTTMGKWTWTSEKGQAALGTREKTQTPYGNMWDLRLFNITKGVDMNANVPIGEVNRTILENLVDAHNATK